MFFSVPECLRVLFSGSWCILVFIRVAERFLVFVSVC